MRIVSNEYREQKRRIRRGKKASVETRRKQSLKRLGMKFSAEHRRKLSLAHKGKRKPLIVNVIQQERPIVNVTKIRAKRSVPKKVRVIVNVIEVKSEKLTTNPLYLQHFETYTEWVNLHIRAKNEDTLICKRWRRDSKNGFENFLEDMGKRQDGMKVCRRDTEEGYYKLNCFWK